MSQPAHGEIDQAWIQGAFVGPDTLADYDEVSSLDLGAQDILLIVSQSCDVIHGSLEEEPFIELLPARKIEQIDGNFSFGKNPRILDFVEQDSSLRCRIHEKFRLPREVLLRKQPTGVLTADTIWQIARWIGKRYTRHAFPDAFNNRLKPAVPAIRKIMRRGGDLITAAFLSLETEDELPDAAVYRLILQATVLPETKKNRELFDVAQKAAAALQSEMNKCSGIEVVDALCISEEEITLYDLRELGRWDYDYISLREDQDIAPT